MRNWFAIAFAVNLLICPGASSNDSALARGTPFSNTLSLVDPVHTAPGSGRVPRGGGWTLASFRDRGEPAAPYLNMEFRLVWTPEQHGES